MKIYVVGPVGSGKSTLAKRISKELDILYVELDSVIWNNDIKRDVLDVQKKFNKILEILKKHCVTYVGKKLVDSLMPNNNKSDVENMLKETFDAVNLSYRNSMPGFYEISNVEIELKNLEVNNTLSCKSLINLKNIFKLSQELKEYFSKDFLDSSEYPSLSPLFYELYTNKDIVTAIETAIIDENTIDDKASSTLKLIRKNIRNTEQNIRDTLNNFIHSSKYSKYIQENIITMRNNRFVIPVKDEYRSEIKGFVHDISNAGSTVFIEPISIFELNNNLSKLKIDEEIEIEKRNEIAAFNKSLGLPVCLADLGIDKSGIQTIVDKAVTLVEWNAIKDRVTKDMFAKAISDCDDYGMTLK
mgnify:CR=1 FL=1